MVKRLIGLVGLLALLSGLVACRPSPTLTSQVAKATESPTLKAAPTATTGPTPTPTPPWQIPVVQESDWVRGGAYAGLTVVEYSDLQ